MTTGRRTPWSTAALVAAAPTLIAHEIKYTTVGEAHAYSDTTASFTYSENAGTNVTTAYAADGVIFKLSGGRLVSNTVKHGTGIHNRHMFGSQINVPINYTTYQDYLSCVHGGRIASGKSIDPTKLVTDATHTDLVRVGADWRSDDGSAAYARFAAAHPTWAAGDPTLGDGVGFSITSGCSLTYTGAVDIGGVTLNAQTLWSTERSQAIVAGDGSFEHDVFCPHGPCTDSGDVFYSF